MERFNKRTKKLPDTISPIMIYPAGNQAGAIYAEYKKLGNDKEEFYMTEEDFQKFYALISDVNRNPQNKELIEEKNRYIKYLNDKYLKAQEEGTPANEQFVRRHFSYIPIEYESDNSGEDGEKLLGYCLMFCNAEPDKYNLERFERLLKTGANPNSIVTTRDGHLIHMAVQYSNGIEYVEKLIEHEADVDVKNKDGWTALHYATHRETNFTSPELRNRYVELLANACAKINEYNSDGMTPLHLAIINGANTNISPLLRNGADMNASVGKNWLVRLFGATPLRLAHQCGNKKAINALEGRGANRWFGKSGWWVIGSVPLPSLAWWFDLLSIWF